MAQNGSSENRLLLLLASVAFSLWSVSVGFATALVVQRIDKIEIQVGEGILPRADERLRNVEQRLTELEDDVESHEH